DHSANSVLRKPRVMVGPARDAAGRALGLSERCVLRADRYGRADPLPVPRATRLLRRRARFARWGAPPARGRPIDSQAAELRAGADSPGPLHGRARTARLAE